MRSSSLTAATLGIALAFNLSGSALAQKSEAAVPIRGTVVSVTRDPASVVLRFTPPGSQPATKRTFNLANHNDALRLKAGQVIDGTADETQTTWVLSNVNIETNKAPQGDVVP